MCILGLYFGVHPLVRFVALHNRDEVVTRGVVPPHDDQRILFGRDTAGGGTWMGYNRDSGVFVALTNVRGTQGPPGVESRGKLVLQLLEGVGPMNFHNIVEVCRLNGVRPHAEGVPTAPGAEIDLHAPYAGFNVIVGRLSSSDAECFFVTNRPPARSDDIGSLSRATASESFVRLSQLAPNVAHVWPLTVGTHALSNSTIDDMTWAKVRWLKQQLEGLGESWSSSPVPASASPVTDSMMLERVLQSVVPIM
jgi:uncharacterized protein with NRDE domain